MSLRSAALSLSLLGSAHGLAVGPAPVRAATQSTVAGSQPSMPSLGRRAALLGAASAALLPLAAHANTQAQFDAPQSGFEEGAEKRKRFLEKQKVFKKKWRKNLAELEFASNDDEAMTAINALIGLIQENGMEIPEGVRKQDMDQVQIPLHSSIDATAPCHCLAALRAAPRCNNSKILVPRLVRVRRCTAPCRTSWPSRRA